MVNLENEIWKPIKGCNGRYQISNMGRVKSMIGNEKLLVPQSSGGGYLQVLLTPYKKAKPEHHYVHRLVAAAFLPDWDKALECNHLNEDVSDNRASNLEMTTHIDNCNYGTRNARIGKRHGVSIRCIETGIEYDQIKEAAKLIGRSTQSLGVALKNGTKCAGYHWEYA